MKIRKHTVFISISLVVLAVVAIAVFADILFEYRGIQTDFADNVRRANDMTVSLATVTVFFIVPILFVGLSCIRSVYKILRYAPKGIAKPCYHFSAAWSLLAFAFLLLWFAGWIDFQAGIQEPVLFLAGWPTFAASFLLGSIPIKCRD